MSQPFFGCLTNRIAQERHFTQRGNKKTKEKNTCALSNTTNNCSQYQQQVYRQNQLSLCQKCSRFPIIPQPDSFILCTYSIVSNEIYMLRRWRRRRRKKKKHITDVILLNRVLLYSVICGLWRKTEGRTEKSEPKENTILYDYHWLYCYVELVLLFKSKNGKTKQEVIKLEEKFPFLLYIHWFRKQAKDLTGWESLLPQLFKLSEWKGWKKCFLSWFFTFSFVW